ncbi:hypothetical protein BCR32DRAFT_328847 [Anaeromyces robustus]|jgi:hypothetical protein|uniref:Phosphoglycerate mutase-like protein n=1 Tax=Anaeromyces robustus TaxID=1754192 RepID=A0A1Y1WVY4_9FUNG|nr:hypothetical protein BCR32DRAFT_328847 [Anaeromyces robustus]|eukprot:ORX77673.1 hypothetical protein BCR32DRAFT_328847 [Anaeromyces robustus]
MQLKFLINTLLGITLVNARIIMLLRHGEKLDDSMVYLSNQGIARSECLAEKFGTVFYPPNKIYSQCPNEEKPSTRPRDTATPIAQKFNLNITLYYNKGQADALVKDIKQSPEEIVLVSWSNDELNNIAKEFGIPNPPAWDGKIFDQLWIINKIGDPFVLEGNDIKPLAVYYGKENNMKVVKQDVDDCIVERLRRSGNDPSVTNSKTTRIIRIVKTSQPSDKSNDDDDDTSNSYKMKTNIIVVFGIIFTVISILI